ncbi:hypothetical protein ZHAS_00013398 [Anopheles sinensis]|uniref:Uncharacterized protein n=1 Tax=Anopheles sinensis TaxID=74873 RepID=A0A084W5G7_ANOSI|nr:hypothetical protein ZHAS_00013398 [Anopheles sinensis]
MFHFSNRTPGGTNWNRKIRAETASEPVAGKLLSGKVRASEREFRGLNHPPHGRLFFHRAFKENRSYRA